MCLNHPGSSLIPRSVEKTVSHRASLWLHQRLGNTVLGWGRVIQLDGHQHTPHISHTPHFAHHRLGTVSPWFLLPLFLKTNLDQRSQWDKLQLHLCSWTWGPTWFLLFPFPLFKVHSPSAINSAGAWWLSWWGDLSFISLRSKHLIMMLFLVRCWWTNLFMFCSVTMEQMSVECLPHGLPGFHICVFFV